jgi:hypothetical protein
MENRKAVSYPLRAPGVTQALVFLLACAAAVRLIFAAKSDSMDFHVYWRAAHQWAELGLSPYVYDASDRGFVFKYPPWILPFFTPLAFLSFEASKMVWVSVELFCIFYSVYRLIQLGVRAQAAIWVGALFWWIWLGHVFAGQFTLTLLASALWAAPATEKKETSPGLLALVGVLFSAKVFSLISLIGRWREFFSWRTILAGIALLVGLHGVVLGVILTRGHWVGLVELYQQWVQAAASGGQELGAFVVRGQMNHGFTAGILRAFHVPASETSVDYKVALGLAALFSGLWFWASKKLDRLESWVGWLGVGLIVHPLAWHHSFVLAYPVCAVALDRAMKSKNRLAMTLASLGTCCVGIFIPNVIGITLATPLELVSVKSWGVCLAALALVLSSQSKAQSS